MEINLTKVKPTFTKTFVLAEPVCPEVLRLNSGLRRLELYEIELF